MNSFIIKLLYTVISSTAHMYSYHMTHMAPQEISFENHKNVWGSYASKW